MARTLEVGEHAVGRVAVVGVGGEHGAQLAHARGGLGAVAHHVADHQQQAAVLERMGDVEVAADVAPAGAGQVARRELDPGQVGEPGREQRALQRQREPPLGTEQHRVVERDRRPARPARSARAGRARRRPGPATMIAPSIRPRETSGSVSAGCSPTVGAAR